jgi:uncharacterized protein YjbJ (UPF0337 family)
MNKDRIAGAAKEISGSVKETIGKAAGDAKLQSDGKAEKVEGKDGGATQEEALQFSLTAYRLSSRASQV